MVKTYLKYQLKDVLGQISGKQSKGCISQDGKILYTGCNEYVIAFDLKTAQIISKIKPDSGIKSEVTCINIDKSNKQLVVGYNNGTIIIYDVKEGYKSSKTFSLHKSAVTCLEFNTSENLLASGGKDTNIIIWDIIGETALYRLTGHKDGITKIMFRELQIDAVEEGKTEILISSAKDNTIKLWNIKNQETIQTIADLIHKVTDFNLCEDILLIGSFDQKLRLYQFGKASQLNKSGKSQNNYFVNKGFVNRQSSAKILSINVSHDEKLISILSNDNTLEFLKILSEKEVKYRIMKGDMDKNEKNDKREKLIVKEKFEEISEKAKNLINNKDFNYKLKYYSLFKFIGESKLMSVNFVRNSMSHFNSSGKAGSKNIYKFCICLGNNSVELYELNTSLVDQNIFFKKGFAIEEKKADEENLNVQKVSCLDSFGHRDVLRNITFSERENLFLTASNDSVKLWNYSTLNVLKGLSLESIISTAFILDDKFIILGSRKGKLYLVNTITFEIVQEVESAHAGEIWSIHPVIYSYVDKKYKVLTCSSDKTIKYWTINSLIKTNSSIKDAITEYKTIEALDQLTSCMLTPDHKYLIYSMLDNSIKIFYEDTNKIFLTLYGHKLPVLSIDVSSDGALLVSGSSDKNVKLWGMDFGDCHKSFFAHQDSVTTVKFVNKTHYFFSASKDNVVRYWDGDTYDLIMELSDFFGNVWSLDVNHSGTAMIAVSADSSIRVYELSKEQVIPDWEKEKKLDRIIEDEMQKELDANKGNMNPLNKEIEKIVPIKKSLDNIGFAEDLMDSLEVAEKFKSDVYQYEIDRDEYKMVKTKNFEKIKAYNLEEPEVPKASPMLLGKNIFDYVLHKLQGIRHSDIEGALNNLPYSYVQILIFYLEYFIRNNIEIELNAKCILFITVLFESQLSNDKTLVKLLQSIRIHLKKNLGLAKEIVSFNVQSIDFIIRSYHTQQKSMEEYKNAYQLNKLI